MFARTITDEVESNAGTVDGLSLLPTTVAFETEKHLALIDGSWDGQPVRGYEIHHGIAIVDGGSEQFLGGCREGSVWGTTWHGLFENDGFRRAFLARAAATAVVQFDEIQPAGYLAFAERRDSMIDRSADMIEQHLDTEALLKLLQ